ncbi:MAG: hypothetical protein Q9187_006225, partial [Circinaria calcarea]
HCPPTPSATKLLLERIAFIRQTHYGGFYDFTSDLSSKDTAYTNLALQAHTDTTYFTEPAGLQMFHLLSHNDGSGGESLLVDGFKAAQILKDEDPAAHHLLSNATVPAHASGNEGIRIHPAFEYPVLNHHPKTGEVLQVRWNNEDRAALNIAVQHLDAWYDAARKWVEILRRPSLEYWEPLRPGKPALEAARETSSGPAKSSPKSPGKPKPIPRIRKIPSSKPKLLPNQQASRRDITVE